MISFGLTTSLSSSCDRGRLGHWLEQQARPLRVNEYTIVCPILLKLGFLCTLYLHDGTCLYSPRGKQLDIHVYLTNLNTIGRLLQLLNGKTTTHRDVNSCECYLAGTKLDRDLEVSILRGRQWQDGRGPRGGYRILKGAGPSENLGQKTRMNFATWGTFSAKFVPPWALFRNMCPSWGPVAIRWGNLGQGVGPWPPSPRPCIRPWHFISFWYLSFSLV